MLFVSGCFSVVFLLLMFLIGISQMKVMKYKIVILGLCLLCAGRVWAAAEPQNQAPQPAPAAGQAAQANGAQPAAAAPQANNGQQAQDANVLMQQVVQGIGNIEAILGNLQQQQNEQHGAVGANPQANEARVNQLLAQLDQNLHALRDANARLQQQLPQPLTNRELAERVAFVGGIGGGATVAGTAFLKYLATPIFIKVTESGGWINEWVRTLTQQGPTFLLWFLHHPTGRREWAAIAATGAVISAAGYMIYKHYYPNR